MTTNSRILWWTSSHAVVFQLLLIVLLLRNKNGRASVLVLVLVLVPAAALIRWLSPAEPSSETEHMFLGPFKNRWTGKTMALLWFCFSPVSVLAWFWLGSVSVLVWLCFSSLFGYRVGFSSHVIGLTLIPSWLYSGGFWGGFFGVISKIWLKHGK